MKSLFEKDSYEEIQIRIGRLKETSEGQWGKMTIGQMLWHCQVPVKWAISNKKTNSRGNPIVRWFFKKSMYNDTPWRKNLPTIPEARAREVKDFATEKKILLELLAQLHTLKNRENWNPHPTFGTLTKEQWGQMQYKHLDHHLRQFAV